MNAPYAPTEKTTGSKPPLRRTEPPRFREKQRRRHTNILRTTVLFRRHNFGVPVGGMDYENARNAMLDALSAEFSKINISVTVDNVTIVLTASDFRITTNINELLSSAFKLGRSDSDPYQNYLKRVEIAENGFEVGSYTIRMDEESVAAIVSEAAAQLDHPVEPYVTLLNRVGGGKPVTARAAIFQPFAKLKRSKLPTEQLSERSFHTGSNGFCLNREDMLKQISEAFNSGIITRLFRSFSRKLNPKAM